MHKSLSLLMLRRLHVIQRNKESMDNSLGFFGEAMILRYLRQYKSQMTLPLTRHPPLRYLVGRDPRSLERLWQYVFRRRT